MKALVVLLTLLTTTPQSGNGVCVEGGRGDREEGRTNVFGLGYYLYNSQE